MLGEPNRCPVSHPFTEFLWGVKMAVDAQSKINPQVQPQKTGGAQPQKGPTAVNITPHKTDHSLSLIVAKFLGMLGVKVKVDTVPGSPSLPDYVKSVCQKNIAEIRSEFRTVPERLISFALNKTQNPKLIEALNVHLNEKTRNDWAKAAPQLPEIPLRQLAASEPPKPQMPVPMETKKPANQVDKILSGQPDFSETPETSSCIIHSPLPKFIAFCGDNKLGGLTSDVTGPAVTEIITVGVA